MIDDHRPIAGRNSANWRFDTARGSAFFWRENDNLPQNEGASIEQVGVTKVA